MGTINSIYSHWFLECAREAPTINTGEICGIIKAWRMIRWTVFDMEDDKVDGITLYDTMYAADVT